MPSASGRESFDVESNKPFIDRANTSSWTTRALLAVVGLSLAFGAIWFAFFHHPSSSGGAGDTPDTTAVTTLFVVHDAGETLALLPVIRFLLQAPDAPKMLVLPLGEPATSKILCKGRHDNSDCLKEQVPSVTLTQMGIDVSTLITDGTGGRSQKLEDKHLQLLSANFPAVSAVVTGMNYEMQLQIGKQLMGSGARFAAYYDGFTLPGTDTDNHRGVQVDFAKYADEIWVPSDLQRDHHRNLEPPREEGLQPLQWFTVGQPTLDEWTKLSNDQAALRKTRSLIYEDDYKTPAIVWFGGYGQSYEDALRVWCRAAKNISEEMTVLFALTSHPDLWHQEDRVLQEKRVLQEEGVSDLIRIVPNDIPSALVALVSNLTVSQGSTGGDQSLFMGKPAMFVDPSDKNKFGAHGAHLGATIGFIPTVKTSAEAISMVEEVGSNYWGTDQEMGLDQEMLRNKTGLPLNATVTIADHVRKLR